MTLKIVTDHDAEAERALALSDEDAMHTLKRRMTEARRLHDEDAIERIRSEAAPIQERQRRREGEDRCGRVAPFDWMRGATEEAIESRIAAAAIRTAAAEPELASRNVLLLGPSGVGKSTGLALILRRVLTSQPRLDAKWFYSRALCAAPMQHRLGTGECKEVYDAQQVSLLVLDDLGLERDHGPLLDVLNERYERRRTTWASSGLTLEQLTERFGEAIVRRLVESHGEPGLVVSAFQKRGPR